VVLTELAGAADMVLPGATYLEKDGLYTNDQGRVQAASAVIAPPGEALDDWKILTNIATLLGLPMTYRSSADVRQAIAAAMPASPYAEADSTVFTRPVSARNWLQASNPSERWKWDFLFQDLPPVKGHSVQMEEVVSRLQIPLKPVE
jgi:predicted molibdopterin-dependent oxidoreductase YjgC